MLLHLFHEGDGVRNMVQHQRAEHHVRRRRLRLFPWFVDDRDVGESGFCRAGLEHLDRVHRRLDDGHVPGPRRQGQRKPARASADVEDVSIRPQNGVEAVQHRVVGTPGVEGPVGASESAVGVPMPVAVGMPTAAQCAGVALVRQYLIAPGIERGVHRTAPRRGWSGWSGNPGRGYTTRHTLEGQDRGCEIPACAGISQPSSVQPRRRQSSSGRS